MVEGEDIICMPPSWTAHTVDFASTARTRLGGWERGSRHVDPRRAAGTPLGPRTAIITAQGSTASGDGCGARVPVRRLCKRGSCPRNIDAGNQLS